MPAPGPNKPITDYPFTSIIVDTLLSEKSSSFVGNWTPIEPGAPFKAAPTHSTAEAALFAGTISLGQRAGKDNEYQERFWATLPHTQDVYNYDVSYSGKSAAQPIFKRRYLELRDQYPTLVRANLSPFTGLYAVTITAKGSGYDPANPPAVTCNNGATAIAIVDPSDGSIAKITLKAEGSNCTTSVTIAAPPAGGVQATAVGVLQPANCLLIEESAISAPAPWDALYLAVDRTYETLPGPIFEDIVPDAELGIPVATTTQRRAATDTWTCGEIAPIAFNTTGNATVATQTVVQLVSAPDFLVGEWVVAQGTSNTTPNLSTGFSSIKVVAINGNFVTLDAHVTVSSGALGGHLQRYSYMDVERRKTDNINVVEMVTTRALVADITDYNQSTLSPRPYPYPDALLEIIGYTDTTAGASTGSSSSYTFSFSGGVGFKILNGFRGDCIATKIRVFSMGPFTAMPVDPDTNMAYNPTVVIPATGTVTVQGGAISASENPNGTSGSTSVSFKGVTIPPVLTYAWDGSVTIVGSGSASFTVDLPDSIIQDFHGSPRQGWVQGEIIVTIDPVEKLRGIVVYMMTIWKIQVPYTTGIGPA